MSGTKVRLQVQPGERTAAALQTYRDRFLELRRVQARERLARSREIVPGARGLPAELRELSARRDAIRITAPAARQSEPIMRQAAQRSATVATRPAPVLVQHARTAVLAADYALRQAANRPSGQTVQRAREAVLAAERAEEHAELARAQQQLLFAQLLRNLPPGLTSAAPHRDQSGVLSARLDLPGAGTVGVELGDEGDVLLDMADSAVEEILTTDGTIAGCDAERYLAEQILNGWQHAEIHVTCNHFESTRQTDQTTVERGRAV